MKTGWVVSPVESTAKNMMSSHISRDAISNRARSDRKMLSNVLSLIHSVWIS